MAVQMHTSFHKASLYSENQETFLEPPLTKTMTKTFLIKTKKLCKKQKETQNVQKTQSTPTSIRNIQPKLFNLSNATLSKCQTSIFLRGSKFTATPIINSIQLTFDHKTFAHKLKSTEYFDDHNAT